jgi:hypothetical protein
MASLITSLSPRYPVASTNIEMLVSKGNFLTGAEAIADLCKYNQPEIEEALKPVLSETPSYPSSVGENLTQVIADYLDCLDRPLCKYLPRGLVISRNCFQERKNNREPSDPLHCHQCLRRLIQGRMFTREAQGRIHASLDTNHEVSV